MTLIGHATYMYYDAKQHTILLVIIIKAASHVEKQIGVRSCIEQCNDKISLVSKSNCHNFARTHHVPLLHTDFVETENTMQVTHVRQ